MTDELSEEGAQGKALPRILTYAVETRRWRRTFCLVFSGLFAAGLALAGMRWLPGIWARAILLHEQSKWMNYHPSPDQVVLFNDDSRFSQCSVEAANLMKTSQFSYNDKLVWDDVGVMCRRHDALDSFLLVSNGGFNRDHTSIVFCGGRSCPSGNRFVLFSIYDTSRSEGNRRVQGMHYHTEVLVPAGLATGITHVSSRFGGSSIGFIHHNPTDVVRIFAGQADPADQSHFTVDYMINDKRGVIDGFLQADGITASVGLRDGGPLHPIAQEP